MIHTELYVGNTRTRIELLVTCEGMTVTVHAGTFAINGHQYELTEDYTATLPSATSKVSVRGSLVVNAAGEAALFVDDSVYAEGRYDRYDFSEDDFKPVYLLFIVDYPANTTDLADHAIKVFHKKPETDNG